MADITAAQVKELRERTNVSMMECKRALVEAQGDIDAATKLLRERGMAVAVKKASRAANQGLVASAAADSGRTVSLVEVNCETDFVARNPGFIAFVNELAAHACDTDAKLSETHKDQIVAKVAEIGENIVVRRNARFALEGHGAVKSYIHLGGKVGVLVDVGCEKAETADEASFKEVVNDLTLHVAACNPRFLASEEVGQEEIASEREIYAKQVEDKPANVIEKIVDGKMRKYFAEVCLLDQGYVKEPKQSISAWLAESGKALGDVLTVRRFVRYQIGG